MSISVRFREVVKEFGPVRVLHGISFDLPPGQAYGLLARTARARRRS
jgi:ribose transport system ATP-binding protein